MAEGGLAGVLHVGCGGDPLPYPEWLGGLQETRLDIDPRWNPDVLASMTDMGEIGPFGAVFCSHALEHLHQHDAAQALREFYRVLEPGGYAAVFVPDLEGVCPTSDVLYVSPDGPITGHDLFYGSGKRIPTMPHMAHRSGFVQKTLEAAIREAGFSKVLVNRLSSYNLMGVGIK